MHSYERTIVCQFTCADVVYFLFVFSIHAFSFLSVSYCVFQRNCREKAVSRRWVTARAPQVAAFLVTLKVTALLCPPTRASHSAFTPQLSPRELSPLWQVPLFYPITGICFPFSVRMDVVVCNVDFSFHPTNRRAKSSENPFKSGWKRRWDLHAGFQLMCHLILTCVTNMSYVEKERERRKFSSCILCKGFHSCHFVLLSNTLIRWLVQKCLVCSRDMFMPIYHRALVCIQAITSCMCLLFNMWYVSWFPLSQSFGHVRLNMYFPLAKGHFNKGF